MFFYYIYSHNHNIDPEEIKKREDEERLKREGEIKKRLEEEEK